MIEWTNIFACFVAYALYELYLRRLTRHAPMKTARSAHAEIRSEWVKSLMSRSGTEILGIQTLRNSVMAASFMATTAVLALSGVLSLSGVGSPGNAMWQAVHGGQHDALIFATKLLLLAGSFFVSFLCMSMAVRFFNHAGYLIGSASAAPDIEKRQTLTIMYLNRAGQQYSLGLRAFFCCIPFLAGLFSNWLMLPATLLLILILYRFDRIPHSEQ